jgi:hypothetical protein
MRTQKLITINLMDNENKPVIDPITGNQSTLILDENDYDTLLSKAKVKFPIGLTDRQYMERMINEALREKIMQD